MAVDVGSKLQGKVTGITPFGAFIELPDGVTGLVHISEIAEKYVRDVNDVLKINDYVTVKVINVEDNGKIGLSIRQAIEKPINEKKGSYDSKGGSNKDRYKKEMTAEKFEDKLSKYLKDSEDRLSSLKRNLDSKRGGRGSRRGF